MTAAQLLVNMKQAPLDVAHSDVVARLEDPDGQPDKFYVVTNCHVEKGRIIVSLGQQVTI